MRLEEKNQIKRLRAEGHSYGRVATMLGLSENTVKSFCRRNGLAGRGEVEKNVDEDAHTCKCCGLPVKQNPGRKEKKFCSYSCRMRWWKEHSDQVQRKANYQFECAFCHKPFTAYGNANRKYCCHECYVADRFGGESNE